MYRITLFLLVVLSLSSVLAAPTSYERKKRSFKVERVRRNDYIPNGALALRKAYNKFGIIGVGSSPVADTTTQLETDDTSTANTSSENGEVSATPSQNDAEFLSPVSIGGQTLVMDFDTGSSDMWVFNTELSQKSQAGHTLFDPTKSSTFQLMTGSTFNISYGDGSFSQGQVGTDTVNIGGAIVNGQAFGLATNVASSFVGDTASNGLVGLAFSKLNTIKPQKQKTFFDNVVGDLAQPVFTANLKHGVAGGYEFGTIDSTQFQGSLTTVPVDSSSGFWQFTSKTIAIGNGQPQTVSGGSGIAIADTGTSLMIVDDAVVQAYWSQVEGAQDDAQSGGVIFPCTSALPDLQVAVGDSYMATISGSLLNFAEAGSNSQTGQAFCFGGVQSNSGSDLQIFGDIFFKSQFVAFDGSGPSLGVAPHA